MKVIDHNNNSNTIKAKFAVSGEPYYYINGSRRILILAFTPCQRQEEGYDNKRHFIRLMEEDVSVILLDHNENLIPAGNLTCTINP